jgi:hypothetical protein
MNPPVKKREVAAMCMHIMRSLHKNEVRISVD